jgi:hypothetical protein
MYSERLKSVKWLTISFFVVHILGDYSLFQAYDFLHAYKCGIFLRLHHNYKRIGEDDVIIDVDLEHIYSNSSKKYILPIGSDYDLMNSKHVSENNDTDYFDSRGLLICDTSLLKQESIPHKDCSKNSGSVRNMAFFSIV